MRGRMGKEEKAVKKQVEVEIEPVEKDEKAVLVEKIREIKKEHFPKLRNTSWMLSATIFFPLSIAGLILALSWDNISSTFIILTLYFGLLVPIVPVLLALPQHRAEIRDCEEQLRQAEDDLDLLEVAEGDNVKRSEKLFRNNQKELKRYYDINLNHYRWIFPVGVLTVILGSAIIGGTIWVFRGAIKDSIAPILIGAVSGVLVDFIGAVLIHMYMETVKSSIEFHRQLMKSNHALFANMLAFKIEDPVKHDETFAELAKLMIQSNVEPKK